MNAVERLSDVGQERGGIVVAAVQRDPGKRTRVAVRPLGEQRRLSVARRRRDREDARVVRCAQSVDERGATNDARAQRWDRKLGLNDLEGGIPLDPGQPRPRPTASPCARWRVRSWLAHSAQRPPPPGSARQKRRPTPSVRNEFSCSHRVRVSAQNGQKAGHDLDHPVRTMALAVRSVIVRSMILTRLQRRPSRDPAGDAEEGIAGGLAPTGG